MKTLRETTRMSAVLLLGCWVSSPPSLAVYELGASLLAERSATRPPRRTKGGVGGQPERCRGSTRSRVQTLLGKLPLYFIENGGQEDSRVAYYVQGKDTAVYFTRRA